MPRRTSLPAPFSVTPFTVSAAMEAGLTRGRLRSSDLQRPFHGVRTSASTVGTEALCNALLPRLARGGVFSHQTAAALWRIPLPLHSSTQQLHVSVRPPQRAPEVRGVRGHRLALLSEDVMLRGLPVSSPAAVWCQLAESLEVHDLVAAAEWILTGNPYADVLPLATSGDLERCVGSLNRARGSPKLRVALRLMREGALSRPESLLRLLCTGSGLPEPRINQNCTDERGSFVALVDLLWDQFNVVVEYQGDHHRKTGQFRKDIHRIERLIDSGKAVVSVSADDLFDRPVETMSRIASRLRDGGWGGSLDVRHVVKFDR